jgi:uncharacterized membrane protein
MVGSVSAVPPDFGVVAGGRREQTVSDLVAIAYPDEAAAMRALRNVWEGLEQNVFEVEDALVIVRAEDGSIQIRQGSRGTGAAAVGGAMWGGLVGLALMVPLLGMAAGAAAGAAAWKHTIGDVGISEDFVNDLSESLTPGSAVLVLLILKMTPEKVLPRLQEQGRVIQTSLGENFEKQLQAALSAAGTRNPG